MLERCVVVLLSCIAAASLIQATIKLGDLVNPCSLKDPNLDECMTIQGRALLPHLVAGIEDFGFLPMDPLSVPNLCAERRGGPFLNLKINATNTTQVGYRNMEIESIRFDPVNYIMKLDATFPSYIITGKYGVDGHVLLIPISGSGTVNITLIHMVYRHTFTFQPEERGGEKYLQLTKIKANLSTKKMFWKVDNLFGNKALSDVMNLFLNRNSAAVFRELKQDLQELTSEINISILSRLFSKIPMNQLFRDID